MPACRVGRGERERERGYAHVGERETERAYTR